MKLFVKIFAGLSICAFLFIFSFAVLTCKDDSESAPTAPPSGTEEIPFTVTGEEARPWQATPVYTNSGAEPVSVTVTDLSGALHYWSNTSHDPCLQDPCGYVINNPPCDLENGYNMGPCGIQNIEGCNCMSLGARIDPNGGTWNIGCGGFQIMHPGQSLWLGINDNASFYYDNFGTYSGTLVVTPMTEYCQPSEDDPTGAQTYVVLPSNCRLVNSTWGWDLDITGQYHNDPITDYSQCIFEWSDPEGELINCGWNWRWPHPIQHFWTKAYPHILFGKNPYDDQPSTSPHELPTQLSNIEEIEVRYKANIELTGLINDYNLCFDLWIVDAADPHQSDIVAEVMVWESHTYSPLPWYVPVPTLPCIVDGVAYTLYYLPHPPAPHIYPYYAFVPMLWSPNVEDRVIRLDRFIGFLRDWGAISNNTFLSNITFGNELVQGEGTTEIRDYSIDISFRNWRKHPNNPVIPSYSFSPWVILDNGTYRMWYCAGSITDEDLYYRESADGINWSASQTALSRPNYQFGRVCVIKEGSTYKMWYTGDGSVTYYTSSSDPHSFPVGTTVSGLTGYGLATIVRNGSEYWGWEMLNGGIYRAVSSDGLTWSVDSQPALEHGATGEWDADDVSPGYVLHDDRWYLFYIGDHGNENDRIGWAWSSDGLTWTKQTDNPIVAPGSGAAWDRHQVSLGAVQRNGDELQMWYTGNIGSGGSGNAIGYAYRSVPAQ